MPDREGCIPITLHQVSSPTASAACRSERILFARFSGLGGFLKRLVRLTTPPLMRSSVKNPIQFSRCYVNFPLSFCSHRKWAFYALCSVHCPLLKGHRHAPLCSPVFKKFFPTSYECTTKRKIHNILLCSITTNGTEMICEKSLTSHSFHDKIELVIS